MTLPCGCELGIEEEYNKTDKTFYDLPSIEFCPTMKHAEEMRDFIKSIYVQLDADGCIRAKNILDLTKNDTETG